MEPSKLTPFDFRRIERNRPESDDDPYLREARAYYYMGKELPTESDWIAYSYWKRSQEMAQQLIPEGLNYTFRIFETNFHDPMQVDYLMKLLEHPKPMYMPLGKYKGTLYRLKPNPSTLNSEVIVFEDRTRQVLPYMYLGLNMGVNPKMTAGGLRLNSGTIPATTEHDVKHVRRDSGASPTISNDNTGFVFFQLGILEFADPQQLARAQNSTTPDIMSWARSEYTVVVKISVTGRSQDVYLIKEQYSSTQDHAFKRFTSFFSFHGADPIGWRRGEPWPGKRWPVIRIATSIQDLGPDTILKYNESHHGGDIIDFPYSLCAAVLEREVGSDNQRIVRQYVPMSKREQEVTDNFIKERREAEERYLDSLWEGENDYVSEIRVNGGKIKQENKEGRVKIEDGVRVKSEPMDEGSGEVRVKIEVKEEEEGS